LKGQYQNMNLATKNVATVLVGSVLVLALSFAFVTPTKADMLSDLQAQVQALLAQIASLGGGSTSGTGCFAFTMTHQQGDSGGEVMNIQKFLNSHGAQVSVSGAGSPGNESAYFGAMTKAAVAKWQAANGVSPAAGYWGPVTRAKVASVCASTPSTPTTPTTGGETLNGSAGSASVSETSNDVDEDLFTGETEKVLGFRVEASGGDIRVTNTRVKFTYTGGSTPSDRLADYASEISIWANGQKIASMSPSSFVRDSSGVYSASIPVSQVVRMGSNNKVTFHVGMTAASSIDSDDVAGTWTVDLVQTRYADATGVTLFDNTASIQNTGVNVARLSSSGDVTLRMSEGSGNPKAGNVEVSDDGSSDVTLAEFTLKAEGSAMEFDSLVASTTVTGVTNVSTMVQEFYLMRGSTQIAEETAGSGVNQRLTFSLDDTEEIAKDATQTYRIVAKVNEIADSSGSGSAFDQGDSIVASTSPSVADIDAESTSDGKSVTNRSGSVTTYTQTLYSEGIKITKVGDSSTVSNSDTAGSSLGTFKMTLRVSAFGSDDVYVPLSTTPTTTYVGGQTTGVAYSVLRSDGTATSTGASATLARVSGGSIITVSGTDLVKIGGGSSADIELSVTFNPQVGESAGQWRVQVWAVGHDDDAADAAAASIVTTTPVDDFRTSYSATINN
jgi:hypothetical protein